MGTAVVQALITNPYELIKIRQQTVVGQVWKCEPCLMSILLMTLNKLVMPHAALASNPVPT